MISSVIGILYCFKEGFTLSCIPGIFISIFFAILFLQSGLDKIFNYKSEYEWIKEHFSKSILAKATSMLFPVLIGLELITGMGCLFSVIMLFSTEINVYFFFSGILSCITLLALFFGQRVAKDYAGAVSIASYFIVAILGIYLSI